MNSTLFLFIINHREAREETDTAGIIVRTTKRRSFEGCCVSGVPRKPRIGTYI